MPFFDKTFFEILGSQTISMIVGLFAGFLLVAYTEQLLLLPGFLIMLPGFLEMRGNISGSFASRLSSGLFLRIINPEKGMGRIIKGNLFASFVLALAVSLSLGLIAFAFTYITSGIVFTRIIIIPLIAGLIANSIEIPLTLLATFYLFRKGHDPNNIMGPFITSTGDVTSIISLLAAMLII